MTTDDNDVAERAARDAEKRARDRRMADEQEAKLTDEGKEVDAEASRLAALPHAERIVEQGQAAQRLKIRRADLDRLVREKITERAKHLKVVEFPDDVRVDGGGDVYQVIAGKMVYNKPTKDGPIPVYLSNFAAKIVSDVERDDGVETTREYELLVTLRRKTRQFPIAAAEYASLRWVDDKLGAGAVVEPNQNQRLGAAVKAMSDEFVERRVFIHTGWREIGGDWLYLQNGGAIGPNGPVSGIMTDLKAVGLSKYEFPELDSTAAASDVRASLDLLRLAPLNVVVPVLGAVYRAPLGWTPYSTFLVGPTGTFKTELSARAQQHFGPEMTAENLSASWADTANALEIKAFHAKDALMVVDDFAPQSRPDTATLHREAARFIRSQGNRAGRGRLRPDATMRPQKTPRGTVVSTGEDLPNGHSVRARLLIAEVGPDDINLDRLTEAQHLGITGHYARAMAGYIQWLSGRYQEIQDGLQDEFVSLRASFSGDLGHTHESQVPLLTTSSGFAIS